ncbi:MAG: NUDIX hydrolase [Mycobacteriales bacterium]|nr:hypothetical protein [Frankia sp.]
MTLVVAVVALVVAVASYLTWTAGRLDRLAARVDAAWAALDAQLVRRAAVATEIAAHATRHTTLDGAAADAMDDAAALAREVASPIEREAVENELTRCIRKAVESADPAGIQPGDTRFADLRSASAKVGLARQFYNDAVRDHRALRRRWLPRLLASRQPEPRGFFEIEDPGFSG